MYPLIVALAQLNALAISQAQAAPGARVLTLAQSIEIALHHNPRLRGAEAGASAKLDQARSVRGHLLPVVNVSAQYDWANMPGDGVNICQLGVDFAPPPQPGQAPRPPPNCGNGPFYPVHDLGFGLGTATVAQPLLGLLHVSQDYLATDDEADAAASDAKTTEAELREQIESGYLGLFEARALQAIAKSSADQLGEQQRIAQSRLAAGVLTKADLLRVGVAVANANQQQIQASVQEQISRASLLTLLGMPPTSTEVDFAEPTELDERRLPTEFDEADRYAREHRPELRSASFETSAAHHRLLARDFALLPELNAVASVIYLDGLPPGIPNVVEMWGLSLSWNVWEWGAGYYQTRAAAAQEDAMSMRLEGTQEQVSLEVDSRLAQEKAAANAVAVAKDAIAQAEEAYRVEASLVKAGEATTTDLLDAQAALTQARLNLVRARYQELRARSTLTRALGA
ncbi:MAG: TolC family protein [Deltaproteobacteria bacterium]